MSFPSRQEQIAYTKRFRKGFRRNTSLEALVIVTAHVTTVVAIAAFAVATVRQQPVAGLALYPLAVWLIGTRYRAFVNIIHECVHFSFAKSPNVNNFVGELLSTLTFISFSGYKHHHVTHHAYTGDYEKDLDFIVSRRYDFHIPLNRELLFRHIRRVFTLEILSEYIDTVMFDRKATKRWQVTRLLYLLMLVLAAAADLFEFGSATMVILIIVPRFVALPIIGYISDFLDHGGLVGLERNLDKSRNYIVHDRLLRAVFFPRNDCYHLVHHLFPAVPTRFFPEVHRILMEEQAQYRAKPHTFRQFLCDPYVTAIQ